MIGEEPGKKGLYIDVVRHVDLTVAQLQMQAEFYAQCRLSWRSREGATHHPLTFDSQRTMCQQSNSSLSGMTQSSQQCNSTINTVVATPTMTRYQISDVSWLLIFQHNKE